jgi:hypothetical protein
MSFLVETGTHPDASARLKSRYRAPELYDLVGRRGWTPARYARFIVDVMIAGLLPPKLAR